MDFDIKAEAKRLFNATWDLFDKGDDRTADDSIDMLHKAHASRYLWGLVGEPVNFARGEWQVSRAYSNLGMGEAAILHALKSLEIAQTDNLGALDVAFGHECVARAYAILGDSENAVYHKQKGLEAAAALDQNDHDYTVGELNSINIPSQ